MRRWSPGRLLRSATDVALAALDGEVEARGSLGVGQVGEVQVGVQDLHVSGLERSRSVDRGLRALVEPEGDGLVGVDAAV